jgi:hypothetical protein
MEDESKEELKRLHQELIRLRRELGEGLRFLRVQSDGTIIIQMGNDEARYRSRKGNTFPR